MTTELLEAPTEGQIELLAKLNRDLRAASKMLGFDEARFLVDTYYQIQRFRVTSHQRIEASQDAGGEPNALLGYTEESFKRLEKNLYVCLGEFARQYTVGEWLQSLTGIGNVISTGFLCYFDIQKAPTAGHFFSFAGYNPNMVWGKGQRRPYCSRLKFICINAGTCIALTSTKTESHYGPWLLKRKLYETDKNERGDYKPEAERLLKVFDFDKSTEAYKANIQGKLSLGQINGRARRWAVKLLLAHTHYVMFKDFYGREPVLPFALAQGDHAHYITPPNYPFTPIEGGKSIKDLLPAPETVAEREERKKAIAERKAARKNQAKEEKAEWKRIKEEAKEA